MIVDELIAILGYETKGEAQLSAFRRNLDGVTKGISAIGVAAGTFVGTLAANAFMQLGNAIGSLPGNVINVSAKFEGFQASLETIEGSAEKAKASLDWITDFAVKTPYELDGITAAFIKLKSYGIDPMDGTLETLGDTASAMNKPLDMAVEAFADATNFQFERLREFGLVASQKGDQVTFQWTKNGQTLTKTLKKSGSEIQRFLKDHFGSTFSGAMIRQSKTWSGMMSNLVDGWNLFQKRVGDKGFFENIKGRLGNLLDYMGQLDANGTLDRWATSISNGLVWAVDQAVFAISRLTKHFRFVSDWVSMNPEMWEKIKYGLMAIGAYVFPKTAALLVLEDVLSFLQGSDSVIGNLAKQLEELTGVDAGAIGNVFAAIAGGGAGLLLAWPIISGVAGAIKALAGSLGLLGGKNVADGLDNLGKAGGDGKPAGKAGKGGMLSGLAFLGQAAAVWGSAVAGAWSLFDPGEGLKNAPRSKIGVDDLIRWVLGTDGSAPTASPYSGDAAKAKAQQQSMNFLSGYEQRMQNAQGNFAKMGADQSGAAVANTINDSSDKSVNVTINQTVQQATDAPAAAASATANAAAGAASRSLPPPRFVPGGV